MNRFTLLNARSIPTLTLISTLLPLTLVAQQTVKVEGLIKGHSRDLVILQTRDNPDLIVEVNGGHGCRPSAGSVDTEFGAGHFAPDSIGRRNGALPEEQNLTSIQLLGGVGWQDTTYQQANTPLQHQNSAAALIYVHARLFRFSSRNIACRDWPGSSSHQCGRFVLH